MLYTDEKQLITKIPHEKVFNHYKALIDPIDFDSIVEELNDRINQDEVHTSSWIPGNDWTNTVFDPIYQVCGENEDEAGKLFGLILWVVMMDHPEPWCFGRYRLNNIPIRGLTYFRINI